MSQARRYAAGRRASCPCMHSTTITSSIFGDHHRFGMPGVNLTDARPVRPQPADDPMTPLLGSDGGRCGRLKVTLWHTCRSGCPGIRNGPVLARPGGPTGMDPCQNLTGSDQGRIPYIIECGAAPE